MPCSLRCLTRVAAGRRKSRNPWDWRRCRLLSQLLQVAGAADCLEQRAALWVQRWARWAQPRAQRDRLLEGQEAQLVPQHRTRWEPTRVLGWQLLSARSVLGHRLQPNRQPERTRC